MKFIYPLLTLLFLSVSGLYAQEQSQIIPSKFENNQIFVEVVTENEDTIRFLTDTGGGGIFISEKAAERIELETHKIEFRGQTMLVTNLPKLKTEYQIPLMPQNFLTEMESLLNIKKEDIGDKMLVMQSQPGLYKILEEEGFVDDGLLGQDWFATRIWTFDYEHKELILHSSDDKDNYFNENIIDFTFQKTNEGKHIHHMPRVQAEIAGEKIDFLFDTGATTFPHEKTKKEMGSNFLGPQQGASFITESKFEEWKEENPDWKIIEKGENFIEADYIEVPEVKIAGHTVGPIWFVSRPDEGFHQMMSSMMDKQVEGALGGSLFQYFRITVNYPEEYAVFELN